MKVIFMLSDFKPSRLFVNRVISRQLYFLNFVLWTACVVLMRCVEFQLITLKSVGVKIVNMSTT